MGVFHSNRSRLDLGDPPRGIAELEDVARHALDGEVLIHRPDECFGRLEDDAVIGEIRNRAAGSEGRDPRSPAAAEAAVHRVVVEVG